MRLISTSCLAMLMLSACSSSIPLVGAKPQPPSVQYLAILQTSLVRTRAQLPQMTASAENAARRIVDGGHLYATGSQPDFVVELVSRAGGLMCISPLTDSSVAKKNDVVLYATRGAIAEEDRLRITKLRGQGAYVVVFSSGVGATAANSPADDAFDNGVSGGSKLGLGKIAPADTVINIINGWTWTGEFIAACTRLGKMPIVFRSVHLPGGSDRIAKYKGQTFHDDMTIAPIERGMLGAQYIDHLTTYLAALRSNGPPSLALAGLRLREATPAHSVLQVMAHMFPAHYQDPRAPQPFESMTRLDENQPPPQGLFTVVLGYQKAPQLAVDAVHFSRDVLLYTSVQRARDDRASYIYYIDLHWPLEDGCVQVNGYDVPALASSGVMQAAVYWALVAQADPPTTAKAH